MPGNVEAGNKSAERLAFEFYLRTGRRLVGAAPAERKFNPYHDPRNGQFTFAPGGPRSVADTVFSDRRGLWKPHRQPAASDARDRSDTSLRSSMAAPGNIEPPVVTGERSGTLRPAQYRPNPRARMGGNGGPPLNDPLVMEQVFPTLRAAAAGSIIAIGDDVLDISGPVRRLTADLHNAEVKRLVLQIQSVDPSYRHQTLGPTLTPEGRANEIRNLRFDRAVALHKIRAESRPLQVEVLRAMQERANSAYEEASRLYESGRLKPRLSREEAIGNFIDGAVRRELRKRFNSNRVDYSVGQAVRVVGREYDSSETDRTFRIPDARVANIAYDVTLTRKTLATPQVRGFFSTDFQPDAVVIVRPTQLGSGSTYVIKRPRR